MSVDRPYVNPLLRKVIAATVAVQIVIVMSSFTVPVLARVGGTRPGRDRNRATCGFQNNYRVFGKDPLRAVT